MKPKDYCAVEDVLCITLLVLLGSNRKIRCLCFCFDFIYFNLTLSCRPEGFPNLDEILRCLNFVLICEVSLVTDL